MDKIISFRIVKLVRSDLSCDFWLRSVQLKPTNNVLGLQRLNDYNHQASSLRKVALRLFTVNTTLQPDRPVPISTQVNIRQTHSNYNKTKYHLHNNQ